MLEHVFPGVVEVAHAGSPSRDCRTIAPGKIAVQCVGCRSRRATGVRGRAKGEERGTYISHSTRVPHTPRDA